jgi:O-antigen/teichoic acid export membrane protein
MQEGTTTLAVRGRANKLMHYLFPLTIALMLVSPYVFTLLYGDGYQTSAFIFNIYLLIICSRVLLPQSFALAFRHHWIVIWSSIIEIVFNIVLSFWWMKLFGVYGLAFATVASYFVQKLILIAYNYKKDGIKLNQYIDVKYYLIYMTLLLLTFVFTTKFMR